MYVSALTLHHSARYLSHVSLVVEIDILVIIFMSSITNMF